MKIDDNEKISIWLAGNTGLRNPMRIQEGFIAFANSPYVGNLHGSENELGFMQYLNDHHIINNESGKDASGSHARKWRLMFERYGFIYGQAKKQNGFLQSELGAMDDITPFGRSFLKANTIPAMQECFLRSLSVEQYWLDDMSGHFSPFRWILSIMLELERRTGSSELSRIEFALWGHTTNPSYDLSEVVDRILDLRDRRKKAVAKKSFDRNEINNRGKNYDKKNQNFTDYCDMNMRYLRISGVLQRKGRGLIISPSKHVIAEALAKTTINTEPMLNILQSLTTGAILPTDNIEIARKVLNDLMKQMKERHISFDISDLPLDTSSDINIARRRLEDIISQTDEIKYAEEQRGKWKEISDYMTLIINGGGKKEYDEDYVIEVPKDETPVYLEWIIWRAALAIDHMINKPYEVRGFKLDSDFMPVSTAGGGRGDLYCEFKDYTILTEVTMSTSSRQEAMEGEPVRRHVSDAVLKYDKPVFGMFIANKIDTNTAETFKHGVWYLKDNQKQRLNIVPFTLKQFQIIFETMFKIQQSHPDKLVELMDYCISKRDKVETPAWKDIIDHVVNYGVFLKDINTIDDIKDYSMVAEENRYGVQKRSSFPYGLYFGTKIRDLVKDRIGYVVGINEEYIWVAFEDKDKPIMMPARKEFFDEGYYVVD